MAQPSLEGEYSSRRQPQWRSSTISISRSSARSTRDEEGQGLAEYALILALIAIVAIVALIFLGSQVSAILNTVGQSV